jgi:hypothetical protein
MMMTKSEMLSLFALASLQNKTLIEFARVIRAMKILSK